MLLLLWRLFGQYICFANCLFVCIWSASACIDDFSSFSSSHSLSTSSSSSQLPPSHLNPAASTNKRSDPKHTNSIDNALILSSKSSSSIQSDFESSSSSSIGSGSQSADELRQANAQLRQYIGDLKLQLAHCEETNLQLVADLDESQQRRESDLCRMEKEWSGRAKTLGDENEQLRRVGEGARLKIGDLSAECAFLNTNLKDALARIELYEQQFAQITQQAHLDSDEIRKLNAELNAEKLRSDELERVNLSLEQQLSELVKVADEQKNVIESLGEKLKEAKSEYETVLNKLKKWGFKV